MPASRNGFNLHLRQKEHIPGRLPSIGECEHLSTDMRVSSSQCDHLRQLCSSSFAGTSSFVVESITCALGFSSQRCITTSAPSHRFSKVKDPVSHAGAFTGEHCPRRLV